MSLRGMHRNTFERIFGMTCLTLVRVQKWHLKRWLVLVQKEVKSTHMFFMIVHLAFSFDVSRKARSQENLDFREQGQSVCWTKILSLTVSNFLVIERLRVTSFKSVFLFSMQFRGDLFSSYLSLNRVNSRASNLDERYSGHEGIWQQYRYPSWARQPLQ